MARLLCGEDLWEEIRRLARQSRSLVAAVAFVGRNPDKLFRWPRRATLIADLSEERVREGTSSARGALKLVRRGVSVHSYPDLHAKVLVFDRYAIVGSMNLSGESQDRLEEAAVLLSRREEVASIQRYIRSLLNNADPLPEEVLKERARKEPRMVAARPARATQREAIWLPDRAWLLPTERHRESAEERRRARELERQLRREYDIPHVEWYMACGAGLYRRAREGDWCFFWWYREKGRPWGSFEGPYRVVQPVDLGARFGERRYRLACYQTYQLPPRDIRLTEARITSLQRLVGDRRPPEDAPEDPLRGNPRLLSKLQRARLQRLLRRWRWL